MLAWDEGKEANAITNDRSARGGGPHRPLIRVWRTGRTIEDYISSMNATFALIPHGKQYATVRLLECMSAGSIPIFVDMDGYVRP